TTSISRANNTPPKQRFNLRSIQKTKRSWFERTEPGPSMSDVTQILQAIEKGDAKAANELLPLVYQELRRLAAHKMSNEAPGHTLQPTALVHEAYLRLVGPSQSQQWDGRGHFFAAAAEAMRRILVESARRKKRLKHGGQLQRVGMDEVELPLLIQDDELLALDEGLDGFGTVDSRADDVLTRCVL